jgi:predicted enzyme involved in methoxymalonyl-ACP biosynthesis
VWTLSARDSFGDMGLTGVLIARRDGSVGVIDTYLLSCRILGRELEYAFAETVMSALERLWGNSDWRASYIATLKNAQVAGFWQSFGFSVTVEDGDETFLTVAASRRVRYTKDLVEISFAEEQLWKNESGK